MKNIDDFPLKSSQLLLQYLCITIFLVVISSSPSLLAQNRSIGKDYAIFFANSDYKENQTFEDLKNPIRDAKALAETLGQDYGFQVELFKNLSKTEIEQKLKLIRTKKFGVEDQLFIFFSGHGDFDEFTAQGYYITNGKTDNRLHLMTLGSTIDLVNCPHILLVVDACYSGTILPKIAWKGRFTRPGESSRSKTKKTISNILKYTSRLVLTSGGKERVQDGTEHSPFARSLLKTFREAFSQSRSLVTYQDLLADLVHIDPRPRTGYLPGHQEGEFVFVSNHFQNLDNTDHSSTLEDYPSNSIVDNPTHTTIRPSNMLLIERNSFIMGSNLGEAEPNGASPAHLVNLESFYLSPTEVTFSEYDLFCSQTSRKKPSDKGWGRGDFPVINVSWFDAIAYCNWLSRQSSLKPVYQQNGNQVSADWSANGYRLPTEAEWEAAAKFNNDNSLFANGKNKASPAEINFDPTDYRRYKYATAGIFRGKTSSVNSLGPKNGFYHLSGNVSEWCYDSFSYSYYQSSPANSPRGPYGSTQKVIRGGSWASNPSELRTWVRKSRAATYRSSQVGFRIAKNAR